jgi:hypothetical protein
MKRILLLALVLLLMGLAVLPSMAQCSRPETPLVQRIEALYGVSYEEFGVYYCQGVTLTAIAQAMYLESLTGQSYSYWLSLLANPQEYSAVLGSLGYSLADISPAYALGRR